jgi:alpha-L-fucosidase
LKVPVSALADHLVYGGAAIHEEDFTVWGAGPVVDDAGRVHLYAARWPEKNVDPAWRKSSEIAHYEADSPQGPFKFVSVVVKSTGHNGQWDAFAPHNPEVKRFGGTYALVYIANTDFRQPPHPLNQSIGMMTATSPYGPWKKVGENGQILDDQQGHFSEGRQVVNPALIKVGQRFFLYYKTAKVHEGKWQTVFGLAIADRLEGPYVHQPKPLTTEGIVIEDASVFAWDRKICLLTTDNHGQVTGIRGALALWVSDDGIDFRKDWIQLGMRPFPAYLPDYDPKQVKRVYGQGPKPERPKVLMQHGKPAYLYVGSGWIYNGGARCVNHVFKIELPEHAGPLPWTQRGDAAASRLPTPSPVQLAWQQAELGVLICYELHTFNEGRYVQSKARVQPIEAINQFNPTHLNTDQWIGTAKEMGARFAILTASHESGFRLWQSQVNPYSLKSVKWGDGKRDIVREFIASCKNYGIQPGIYLGTRWNSHLGVYDFKVTERSPLTQQQYNTLIEKEVEEICTRYGDLFELWFDGGAYGPERGGPDVLSVFERYQENCLFYHNYERADARWGGSESGTVLYPCWATFPYPATGSGESIINRHVSHNEFSLLKQGDPEGRYWMPAMSDAPLRNHEWFWEPGDESKIYPLASLLNMYYKSVGRNSTLILGLTPDTRGLIPNADVKRCREFGRSIRDIFQHTIAETSGTGNLVVLDLPDDASFDHIVIQEDIRMGERVRQFKLDCLRQGQWTELNTGTCIGHKRILKIKPVTGDKIRLSISESIAEPLIKKLAVYSSIQSSAVYLPEQYTETDRPRG